MAQLSEGEIEKLAAEKYAFMETKGFLYYAFIRKTADLEGYQYEL